MDERVEDANKNGRLDPGETDPRRQDTDGDGLKDGYELGVETAPSNHTTDCFISSCPDKWSFTAATSTSPRTNALDRDSDDDGISDRVEGDGSWCYASEGTCAYTPNSARVLNPNANDTDADGLLDGVEIGVQSPGLGTDMTRFRFDWETGSATDPTKADTRRGRPSTSMVRRWAQSTCACSPGGVSNRQTTRFCRSVLIVRTKSLTLVSPPV